MSATDKYVKRPGPWYAKHPIPGGIKIYTFSRIPSIENVMPTNHKKQSIFFIVAMESDCPGLIRMKSLEPAINTVVYTLLNKKRWTKKPLEEHICPCQNTVPSIKTLPPGPGNLRLGSEINPDNPIRNPNPKSGSASASKR